MTTITPIVIGTDNRMKYEFDVQCPECHYPFKAYWGDHKRPYTCPVCQGHGLVSAGFYLITADQKTYSSSSSGPEPCRACQGTGIIYT